MTELLILLPWPGDGNLRYLVNGQNLCDVPKQTKLSHSQPTGLSPTIGCGDAVSHPVITVLSLYLGFGFFLTKLIPIPRFSCYHSFVSHHFYPLNAYPLIVGTRHAVYNSETTATTEKVSHCCSGKSNVGSSRRVEEIQSGLLVSQGIF